MQNTIKCFCCTHVETGTMDDRLYTVLQTGRDYDGYEITGVIGDNVGDNISACKDVYDGFLTGMYWIWKNTDYDYVGLCSYRGYLSKDNKNALQLEDVQQIFENEQKDIIVGFLYFEETIERKFAIGHKGAYMNNLHNPLRYFREVIDKYYPEYSSAVEIVWRGYVINYRHTMIAKRNVFDGYCEWLFSVLEKYERYLKQRHYQMPPRFLGYVAEIIERVWLINNNINVKELPIVMVTEQNRGYK